MEFYHYELICSILWFKFLHTRIHHTNFSLMYQGTFTLRIQNFLHFQWNFISSWWSNEYKWLSQDPTCNLFWFLCFKTFLPKLVSPSLGCSLSANQSVLTVLFSLIFPTEYPNLAEKYSRPYWCLSMSWGTSKCPISNEGHFSHQTTASASNNTKPFSSDTWENSSKLWWFGSTLTEI